MAAMRMSSDATDMIIAFSANQQITGSAKNKLPPQASQPVVASMSRCRGGRPVTSSGRQLSLRLH